MNTTSYIQEVDQALIDQIKNNSQISSLFNGVLNLAEFERFWLGEVLNSFVERIPVEDIDLLGMIESWLRTKICFQLGDDSVWTFSVKDLTYRILEFPTPISKSMAVYLDLFNPKREI